MMRSQAGRPTGTRQGSDPVLIGLTGPIGSGKSSVARMLADLGGIVIDADELARQVAAPGQPAVAAIERRFGSHVVPGGIVDRAALARTVFDDPDALRDLEAIVHPGVRSLVESRLEQAVRDGDPFVVLEAIKLVESDLAARCDEVWLIDAPADVRRGRLIERGMDPADLDRRMAAQGPDLADRLAARADRRIETSGSRESIRECVLDALADVLAPRFAGLPFGPVDGP